MELAKDLSTWRSAAADMVTSSKQSRPASTFSDAVVMCGLEFTSVKSVF